MPTVHFLRLLKTNPVLHQMHSSSFWCPFGHTRDRATGIRTKKKLKCNWALTWFAWNYKNTTSPQTMSSYSIESVWTPNYSHPTLILVCSSTSPFLIGSKVIGQAPPVHIFKLECKEGPQCPFGVCAQLILNTVPIDCVPCCKGRARFLPFWNVAQTRLCGVHKNTITTAFRGDVWRSDANSHLSTPGLFNQATI